jgi:hypothetical protein
VTAEERVDALSNEQIRDILVAVVKSIEANGSTRCVPGLLHEWSLLETVPRRFRKGNHKLH